jgi:dTDP-4-dehydrorhamnose 3,5-epimerase
MIDLRVQPLPLAGAYRIESEPIHDHRGFNARLWCARTFAEHGLPDRFVQMNMISNPKRGTLRGFHYQLPPHAEAKLFRVTRGRIFDAIIDLRPGSPTRLQWTTLELSADTPELLFVPAGFAQAFQTLEDHTEVIYQVSAFYAPDHARGIRHDDPAFGVPWPLPVAVLSERDRDWPDFDAGGLHV